MLTEEEIWKDVKGYEGYYRVSNKGRVKSLEREILKRNGVSATISEKFIKPYIPKIPYSQPLITLCKNNKIFNISYKTLLKNHFKNNYEIYDISSVFKEKKGEVFVPMKGYEGFYEISNFGTVRSLPRRVSRRDGFDRRVEPKILSHNLANLCLSKYKDVRTVSFCDIFAASFHPEYNREFFYVKKLSNTGNLLKDYQYFRKLDYNMITVTDTSGNSTTFNNYKSCARMYGIPENSFIKFFFRDIQGYHKELHGYQFAFKYPVLNKTTGDIKIAAVVINKTKIK